MIFQIINVQLCKPDGFITFHFPPLNNLLTQVHHRHWPLDEELRLSLGATGGKIA